MIVAGFATTYSIRQTLAAQFDARVRAESASLVRIYRQQGLAPLLDAVRHRDSTPARFNFGVQACDGRPLAGRLGRLNAPTGWSEHKKRARNGVDYVTVRVYTVSEPEMCRLSIGDDDDQVQLLSDAVSRGFALGIVWIICLGIAVGIGFSIGIQRKLGAIASTAEAIIDGDLTRRIEVTGSRDDLDRLAQTLNRMLDRIAGLMEGLNQVSSDVAHDLRTPLNRLHQRLEAGLSGAEDPDKALEGALADLDAILATFSALLRIAEMEGGARQSSFTLTDLNAIVGTVSEAFSPAAEDNGQVLTWSTADRVMVVGDAELITQMLVNLVENALRHAGTGARIDISAQSVDGRASLAVRDDGPGIPAVERERVFDRFYRLERSRTTPGSGLGLALAGAIAKLHGAHIALHDHAPGLEARVTFQGTEAALPKHNV